VTVDPVRFDGAVHTGVAVAWPVKLPIPGSAGHADVQAYVSGCDTESDAVTPRATAPPDWTGFGVAVGPDVMVTRSGTESTEMMNDADTDAPYESVILARTVQYCDDPVALTGALQTAVAESSGENDPERRSGPT
jgi:hypothetical protein